MDGFPIIGMEGVKELSVQPVTFAGDPDDDERTGDDGQLDEVASTHPRAAAGKCATYVRTVFV